MIYRHDPYLHEQASRLRSMTLRQKMEEFVRLCEWSSTMARDGIRLKFPEMTEAEVSAEFVRRLVRLKQLDDRLARPGVPPG